MLTTEQIKNRTKTVTRRLGWKFLKAGTILNACEKCMGLKKGEKIKVICQIRVLSVKRERLYEVPRTDVPKEGFDDMSPDDFMWMFVKEMKCKMYDMVTRIEFEYI